MDMKGIQKVVLKDGTTVYQVRPMVRGRRLKAERFDTPEDAYRYRRQMMGQRLVGSIEKAADFAERWTKDYPVVKSGPTRGRLKSERTNYHNEGQIKKFIAAYPDERLDRFDRQMAREFANREPKAAIVMRNVFSDAFDAGLVQSNPFANLNIERSKGRKEQRALSEAEAHALADMAFTVHGPEFGSSVRALILFSFYVGSRIEETCNVRWDDINVAEQEVRIRVAKFDKPRTVLLLPEAIEALRTVTRQPGSPYVFHTKTGKQIGRSNHFWIWNPVRAAWWASLSPAELEQHGELDFHSLRHACGHHFYVTLRLSAQLAAAQLGHANSMLIHELYGHGDQDALERMKEHLRRRRAA